MCSLAFSIKAVRDSHNSLSLFIQTRLTSWACVSCSFKAAAVWFCTADAVEPFFALGSFRQITAAETFFLESEHQPRKGNRKLCKIEYGFATVRVDSVWRQGVGPFFQNASWHWYTRKERKRENKKTKVRWRKKEKIFGETKNEGDSVGDWEACTKGCSEAPASIAIRAAFQRVCLQNDLSCSNQVSSAATDTPHCLLDRSLVLLVVCRK